MFVKRVAFLAWVLVAACDTRSGGVPAAGSASAVPSATALPTGVVPASTGPVLDPAVTALTAAALACKFEQGRFRDCAAAEEFRRSTSDALKGEKGDLAVFLMLLHPNPRMRLLAASRTLESPTRLFGTKENAEALLDQLERETEGEVRDNLAAWAGDIEAERLGLAARVKALAASPNVKVRQAIGYRFLFHKDTPLGYEVVGALLGDADRGVRKAAAMGLSNTAHFSPSPACKLLLEALLGPHAEDAVWSSASLGRCPGLQEKVLDVVDKRTANAAAVANDVGVSHALALASICDDPRARGEQDAPVPTAATRKRAFEVAQRLAGKEVRDGNTRHAALSGLVACDPARASAELAKLSKDADEGLASAAKDKLANLTKAKK